MLSDGFAGGFGRVGAVVSEVAFRVHAVDGIDDVVQQSDVLRRAFDEIIGVQFKGDLRCGGGARHDGVRRVFVAGGPIGAVVAGP